MTSADRVYLNGELVPRHAARISPFDRGFLYGDGFFETTRIEAGVPVFLDRHLRRMAASCAQTGFGADLDVQSIADGVHMLIAANAVHEGYLRVTVSRGAYAGSLAKLETEAPTVFAEARPLELPPLDAPAPIAIVRSAFRRDERSPVVRHKSLSYQLNVLALAEGRKSGADEVYFLNAAGRLTEGAITNLFFARGGRAFTPDVACGLLPGVTREVVLEVCAEEGVAAPERTPDHRASRSSTSPRMASVKATTAGRAAENRKSASSLAGRRGAPATSDRKGARSRPISTWSAPGTAAAGPGGEPTWSPTAASSPDCQAKPGALPWSTSERPATRARAESGAR